MAGERHGRCMGAAWERHAMCESAFSVTENCTNCVSCTWGPVNSLWSVCMPFPPTNVHFYYCTSNTCTWIFRNIVLSINVAKCSATFLRNCSRAYVISSWKWSVCSRRRIAREAKSNPVLFYYVRVLWRCRRCSFEFWNLWRIFQRR